MTYKILYLFLIPIIFLILRNKKQYRWIPFVVLTSLLFLRYDSVSDYFAYVRIYDDIKTTGETYSQVEPAWIFVNKIFSYVPMGWFFLFAISSILPLLMSVKYLEKYNIPIIGTFLIFILQYYFYFDNILRQCISISIFMFSMRFIYERKLLKYLVYNTVGVLFHTSAIITLLLYPLMVFSEKITLKKTTIIIILIATYLAFIGSSVLIINTGMEQLLGMSKDLEYEIIYSGAGLSYLFYALLSTLPLLHFNQKNVAFKPILYVSFFAGILTLFCSNIDVLRRLFLYLFIFQIIAISLYLKDLMIQKKTFVVVLLLLISYVDWYRFVDSYFENSKYYTVFSDNCMKRKFYYRGGRLVDVLQGNGDSTDRNSFTVYKVD